MKRNISWFIAVLGAFVVLAPATGAARKPRPAPPLSYLKENSYSLDAVINQVRNNRQLLLRYANHFHITPEEVIPYFRANLVESYVPKTKRYKVWMKRPDGSTFWRWQTFRAGERVLALKNGEPVLKWACGNPLTERLPKIEKRRVVQQTKQVAPNVQNRERYYTVETPFETPVETPPTRLTALPPEFPTPASEMTQFVSRQPLPRAINPWPAVGLIPFIVDNPPDIPKIPEPGTAILTLVGAAGAGLFARRRSA